MESRSAPARFHMSGAIDGWPQITECGVSIHLQSRGSDIAIRLMGLSLLPLGALAITTLYRMVHAAPPHDASLIELGLAASTFVCMSLGSLLLTLGAHIFDQVEVSARWASRYPGEGKRVWVDAQDAFPPAPGSRRSAS